MRNLFTILTRWIEHVRSYQNNVQSYIIHLTDEALVGGYTLISKWFPCISVAQSKKTSWENPLACVWVFFGHKQKLFKIQQLHIYSI